MERERQAAAEVLAQTKQSHLEAHEDVFESTKT